MLTVFKKLRSLLSPQERRRAMLVFGLMVVVAIVEAMGVASIMPFIAVLANPDAIETNKYLAMAYGALGFSSRQTFTLFVGFSFFLVLTGSLILKALGTWAQLRFSFYRDYAWATRLISHYLRQPYEWFLNRHSADLATTVLSEVEKVVSGVLFPAMQIIAHSLVAIVLLSLLIVADPLLAMTVGGVLGGGYLLIAVIFKRRLKRIGVEREKANRARFHVVQEAFAGIKEVKVGGLENVFVQRFKGPARTMADRRISSHLMSRLPFFYMQGLLFGGLLLILLYLIWRHGNFQAALPFVALYAFAGYRLMPAIQNVYVGVSDTLFYGASLDSLCADFESWQAFEDNREDDSYGGPESRIHLKRSLQFRNVSYVYPGSDRAALHPLSLDIPAFATVGIVGPTGSGKTTMVDIMLGLLRPSQGSILVDDTEITIHGIRLWQRALGYVPQQIFLADDTVARNIAFGLPDKSIDMDAVTRAGRIANLHDFVMKELPDGYETRVGERGVRLSGGQRQRIGIARALYHDPDVLILDEATSALDNLTERAVMDAVHNLENRKTIIMIAHRLTTVRDCDRIYLLEGGTVLDSGNYDELMASNQQFREMVEAV